MIVAVMVCPMCVLHVGQSEPNKVDLLVAQALIAAKGMTQADGKSPSGSQCQCPSGGQCDCKGTCKCGTGCTCGDVCPGKIYFEWCKPYDGSTDRACLWCNGKHVGCYYYAIGTYIGFDGKSCPVEIPFKRPIVSSVPQHEMQRMLSAPMPQSGYFGGGRSGGC